MPAMCREQISGVETHTEVRFVTTEPRCAEPGAKRMVPIVQEAVASAKNTVRKDGKKTSKTILMSAKKKIPVRIACSIAETDVIWPMEPGVAVIAL